MSFSNSESNESENYTNTLNRKRKQRTDNSNSYDEYDIVCYRIDPNESVKKEKQHRRHTVMYDPILLDDYLVPLSPFGNIRGVQSKSKLL